MAEFEEIDGGVRPLSPLNTTSVHRCPRGSAHITISTGLIVLCRRSMGGEIGK